jgi:hypothetical protein|tara:strand:+ start:1243 stop:1584 length:342 start_codon:yes stop_codon:yes gene_type:complete
MAITPASYNIRPQRRADFELQIQFKDSTGTAINISGWSVVAQCWNKDRTTKHGDFTVTIVNASTGTVKIKLPHTVTINLPDEAYYDVMLIDSSGLREYYLEGIVRPSEGYSAP